ncbi:hypothetical protein BGX38DRAFT_1272924 [Terfezia claveryi]|nr:hypothetical protein BGX38DRAFT_1272924 [Terfezia claveryi]
MPQKKRKDNPGKLDKRNPPLKTRVPVTGHPQPPHPQLATATTPTPAQPHQPPPLEIATQVHHQDRAAQIMQATVSDYDTDDEESIGYQESDTDEPIANEADIPAVSMATDIFLREIVRVQRRDIDMALEGSPIEGSSINCKRTVWCLQEILAYIGCAYTACEGFRPGETFDRAAQVFKSELELGGAAWAYSTPPIRSTSHLPPPPPEVADSSTQTTPPPPTISYAEAATNTQQPTIQGLPEKGKGRAEKVPPKEKGKGRAPPPQGPPLKQKPRQTSEGRGKEPAKSPPPQPIGK